MKKLRAKSRVCRGWVRMRGTFCHRYWGLGFRIWGLGFRVWGLGLRVMWRSCAGEEWRIFLQICIVYIGVCVYFVYVYIHRCMYA